jgi:2-polyprenyl-6-methoxyphenol hydroxylase-like FAD-dependent oxidoreductase
MNPTPSADPAAKQPQEADVLVVGAGPVGLALACELTRRGVACRVVDDQGGPTSPSESRALGVHARTLEVFDAMGLASAVVNGGAQVGGIRAYESGRLIADIALDFAGLGTPYPFILTHSQGQTEQRLLERLEALGSSVAWRTRLNGLHHDDNGVTATLTGPDGAGSTFRAGWVVGCDGAHSAVRHRLSLAFEGVGYDERFLLADLQMTWDAARDRAHILLGPDGPIPVFPLPAPGLWRLIDITGRIETDDPVAITRRFGELLARAGFGSATIDETVWTSSFRISRRAVSSLRVGRCFLAGDAAHIHSPVGGQGMNTGIQDAFNLAWKLALVVQGASPAAILDSYQAERHPVALRVLRGTDWATWFVTRVVADQNSLVRVVRDNVAGWLSRLGPFRRQLTRNVSELGINYRQSPLSADNWPLNDSAGGLRAGDRVPDVTLVPPPDGPGRLFDVLRHTGHTLLSFDGIDSPGAGRSAADYAEERLRGLPEGLVRRYRVAPREGGGGAVNDEATLLDPEGRLHTLFDARTPCHALIRPDGYLACRDGIDGENLAAYLGRVFVRAAVNPAGAAGR